MSATYNSSERRRRATSALMTSLTGLCTLLAVSALLVILSYIAWRGIANQFAGDQAKAETVRIALANCLLSLADEDSRDVGVLATAALDALAVEQRAILFSH